jgi:hypothetical protein
MRWYLYQELDPHGERVSATLFPDDGNDHRYVLQPLEPGNQVTLLAERECDDPAQARQWRDQVLGFEGSAEPQEP